MLVTCGPFECMMGPAAPEITIANSDACEMWDPTVEIQVGKVDNGIVDENESSTAVDESANDGIDLGWVTMSTLDMEIESRLLRRR